MARIANSLATRLIVFGLLLVIAGAAARFFLLPKFLSAGLIRVVSAQQTVLAEHVARDIDYKIVERRRFLQRVADTLAQSAKDHEPGTVLNDLGQVTGQTINVTA